MTVIEKMWNTINKSEEKYHSKGKGYEIGANEILALGEYVQSNLFCGVCAIFDYGFIKGVRYQKAQEKKKRKVARV